MVPSKESGFWHLFPRSCKSIDCQTLTGCDTIPLACMQIKRVQLPLAACDVCGLMFTSFKPHALSKFTTALLPWGSLGFHWMRSGNPKGV